MKSGIRCASMLLGVLALTLATSLARCETFVNVDNPLAVKSTWLTGIDGDTIVGFYSINGIYHGFRYENSTFIPFDVPSGINTVPYDISGTSIVGSCWMQKPPGSGNIEPIASGFYFNGSTFATWHDPSDNIAIGTFVTGISDGSIVGWYGTDPYVMRGFVRNGATYTPLDMPGAWSTKPQGISGGTIVGYFSSQYSGPDHGFVYNAGAYTVLDNPQGTDTYLSDISGNNIVGRYRGSDGKLHGCVYDGSSFTTIDHPLGVNGTYLEGISGDTVVGYYYDANNVAHGFITTIPEPSAVLLLISGFAMATVRGCWRRRPNG
jgi:hypothetical protein